MIEVKLVKLGSEIKGYCLESGSTVSSLLRAAQETFVSGSVTRLNVAINEDTILRDGDRIYIGRSTKGNIPFEVNFRRFGASSVNLPAEDGFTIKETLDQLDAEQKRNFYRADGSAAYEFRVSGNQQPVDDSHVLHRPTSGDTLIIVCAQRVKGN